MLPTQINKFHALNQNIVSVENSHWDETQRLDGIG